VGSEFSGLDFMLGVDMFDLDVNEAQ